MTLIESASHILLSKKMIFSPALSTFPPNSVALRLHDSRPLTEQLVGEYPWLPTFFVIYQNSEKYEDIDSTGA